MGFHWGLAIGNVRINIIMARGRGVWGLGGSQGKGEAVRHWLA